MSRRMVEAFADDDSFVMVANVLFDEVLPNVGANAWRVLCCLIRQANGLNRKTLHIGLRDIADASGISTLGIVSEALKELADFEQEGEKHPLILITKPDHQWESWSYEILPRRCAT